MSPQKPDHQRPKYPVHLTPSVRRKNRARYVFVFVVLGLACLCVFGVLVARMTEYQTARDEYETYRQAQSLVTVFTNTSLPIPTESVPPAITQPALRRATATPKPFVSGHLQWLLQKNNDTVAWLDIKDTEIQYPVVQSKDNEFYLAHTFQKEKNQSGAIFLDCWNLPDFTDFNTVIYGHNMNDGSMFHGLREYEHQRFADQHQIIEVTLPDRKLCYQVFAAYVSQGEDTADFRGQSCLSEDQRSAFIKAARKCAVINSDLTVSRHDRLLTLVTCTSGTHPWYFVVHAVLTGEQTNAEVPTGL